MAKVPVERGGERAVSEWRADDDLRAVAPNCAARHFHFVLISYCCATFSFRAYVHVKSGEIAAAGTAARRSTR